MSNLSDVKTLSYPPFDQLTSKQAEFLGSFDSIIACFDVNWSNGEYDSVLTSDEFDIYNGFL